MGQRHTLYGLQLTGTSSLKIGSLVSGSHSVETNTVEPESGAPYPEFSFVQQVNETFEAVSLALGSILGAVAPVGVTCVQTGKTYTDVRLFGRALDPCGTDGSAAGSVHRQVTATKARLWISQISVQGGGLAEISLGGQLLSADGDANASVTVHNAALPTGLVVNEAWRLYSVDVAGVTLDADKITSLTLTPGVAQTPAFGVKSRPSESIVTKTAPRLEIATEDTAFLASFPIGSPVAMSHANTALAFLRYDPSTGEVGDPTDEAHLIISLSGKARAGSVFAASGSGVATGGITGVMTGSAGSPPIVVLTDSSLV